MRVHELICLQRVRLESRRAEVLGEVLHCLRRQEQECRGRDRGGGGKGHQRTTWRLQQEILNTVRLDLREKAIVDVRGKAERGKQDRVPL